jgi:hypothetical protein
MAELDQDIGRSWQIWQRTVSPVSCLARTCRKIWTSTGTAMDLRYYFTGSAPKNWASISARTDRYADCSIGRRFLGFCCSNAAQEVGERTVTDNSFFDWLLVARATDDAEGDPVFGLRRDGRLPRVSSLRDLRGYMRCRGACREALEAAPGVWRRYFVWRRAHRSQST